MSLSSLGPAGLRGRLLMTVGLTAVLVMMLLSWGILYSWRLSLLRQEEGNALAVSRAFSVAVIDALIFADQDLYRTEGFLDNYVEMFMEQNPRLRAITILDPSGRVVARSWEGSRAPVTSAPLDTLAVLEQPLTAITKGAEGTWVLETVLPMATGERRWGVLVLAVEADSIRAQIRRTFFQLATFSAAVSSVMLLLLWLLLGRLLGSLRALVTAMDTVDLKTAAMPALPARRDEIGILYKHFHRMQSRLEQSRDELLTAQHQVWHAERLAAIGRLASSLAHEINNPINGVRSCIYAIRHDLDDREQTLEYLEMMDEGLTHATAVIDKLLGFARRQQAAPEPLDLNEAVDSVHRLVSYSADRKSVRLTTDLDPALPLVRADRQLMVEVVMNLLLNAVDAVDQHGTVTVTTRARNGGVELVVADDGHGVATEIRDQIFDPFFTTKRTGEGTGLGLSITLGIVQSHGGRITVSGAPGEGAVFTVSLPAAAGVEVSTT